MRNVDQLIREALSAEDAKLFDEIDEPSLPEAVLESLQGKTRWLVTMVFVSTLTFVAIAAFSAFRFFQAESTHEMIAWACGFMVSFTTVAIQKVWYWMELNKITMTREIKRFELQLARLSGRLADRSV